MGLKKFITKAKAQVKREVIRNTESGDARDRALQKSRQQQANQDAYNAEQSLRAPAALLFKRMNEELEIKFNFGIGKNDPLIKGENGGQRSVGQMLMDAAGFQHDNVGSWGKARDFLGATSQQNNAVNNPEKFLDLLVAVVKRNRADFGLKNVGQPTKANCLAVLPQEAYFRNAFIKAIDTLNRDMGFNFSGDLGGVNGVERALTAAAEAQPKLAEEDRKQKQDVLNQNVLDLQAQLAAAIVALSAAEGGNQQQQKPILNQQQNDNEQLARDEQLARELQNREQQIFQDQKMAQRFAGGGN